MQAAGGRRWWAYPSRWAALAAGAAAVRSGKACRLWALCRWGRAGAGAWSSCAAVCCWRGHRVRRWRMIHPGAGGGRNIHALCPALPGYFPAFPRGGCRQRPARAGLLIRQAGQAGRCGKRKRPGRRRVVRCCSGLLSALAVRSAAPGASRCISWAAGSAPRSGAAGTGPASTVPAAPDPAATVPAGGAPSGPFLAFAGGVRFSTLPGSALCVGLRLSEL